MVKNARALSALLIVVAAIAAASDTASAQESALNWRIPELAPPEAFRAAEYAARRKALADSLQDGVLVVFGARSPAADYMLFQQNPSFRFLTGIEEPDAALIISKKDGRVEERLFVQPRNPAREVWEGARLGPEGARTQTGIAAEPNDRVIPVLDSLLEITPQMYTLTGTPDAPAAADEQAYDDQVVSRVLAKHANTQVKSV